MMCAQRDWRERLPALAYPAISEGCAPCLAARRPAPLFSSCWISRPDGDLGCHPSRGTTFWLCTGRRFAEQISFVACGFTLRFRVNFLTAEQRASFPVRTSTRKPEGLPDVCDERGDRVFLLGSRFR